MRTAEVTDDCIEAAFVNEVSVVSDSYADEAYVESEELDALLGIESAIRFRIPFLHMTAVRRRWTFPSARRWWSGKNRHPV